MNTTDQMKVSSSAAAVGAVAGATAAEVPMSDLVGRIRQRLASDRCYDKTALDCLDELERRAVVLPAGAAGGVSDDLQDLDGAPWERWTKAQARAGLAIFTLARNHVDVLIPLLKNNAWPTSDPGWQFAEYTAQELLKALSSPALLNKGAAHGR